MSNSDVSGLETAAKEFHWDETRKSGSTTITASIIATEIFEGWDISEKIIGEDMRWYPPSLRDYRRLCEHADKLAEQQTNNSYNQ